jgi:hypothetical protein
MQELSQRDLENVVTALGQRRFIIFLEWWHPNCN